MNEILLTISIINMVLWIITILTNHTHTFILNKKEYTLTELLDKIIRSTNFNKKGKEMTLLEVLKEIYGELEKMNKKINGLIRNQKIITKKVKIK